MFTLRRYRKLFAAGTICLALCLATIWLPAGAAEKITLVQLGHAGHGQEWTDYIESRIAEFEKLHPEVDIQRVIMAATGATAEKFLTLVAGGTPPDLTEMTLAHLGGLVASGHFLDLRPFINKDKDVKPTDYVGIALRALTWTDNTLVGMPLDVYPTATMFNRELFNKAGLPTPDTLSAKEWNWKRVIDISQLLTKDTNGDGKPDEWGIDTVAGLLSYRIPIRQAGGNFWDRDVNPTRSMLLDERTITGLEWIADIYKRQISTTLAFSRGKSGLNFSSSLNNALLAQSQQKINVGTALPAYGPDNNGSHTGTNSIQITKYTKHADIAWEWVKFVTADMEGLKEFVRLTKRMPAYLRVFSLYPQLAGCDPKMLQPYIDVVNNPKSYHPALGPNEPAARSIITQAFQSQVVSGGAAVRTTMESIASQVDRVLSDG